MEIKASMFYKPCGNVFLSYRPVFVIIISVPSSLNLRHKSSFSNFTETFLFPEHEPPRPENIRLKKEKNKLLSVETKLFWMYIVCV